MYMYSEPIRPADSNSDSASIPEKSAFSVRLLHENSRIDYTITSTDNKDNSSFNDEITIAVPQAQAQALRSQPVFRMSVFDSDSGCLFAHVAVTKYRYLMIGYPIAPKSRDISMIMQTL